MMGPLQQALSGTGCSKARKMIVKSSVPIGGLDRTTHLVAQLSVR